MSIYSFFRRCFIINKIAVVIDFLLLISFNSLSQDYDKLFNKERFDIAEKILNKNILSNPNDIYTLYEYSCFYQKKSNPAYNLYYAFLKANEAVLAFKNIRDHKIIAELASKGIEQSLLENNKITICKSVFDSIIISPTISGYNDYLNLFNDSCSFYFLALHKRDSLVYEQASASESKIELQKYVESYPNSKFNTFAIAKIDSIEFNIAVSKGDIIEYDIFLQKHPNSRYHEIAKQKRNTLAFNIAMQINTEKAYDEFIKAYPDADEISNAKNLKEAVAYKSIENDTNSNRFTNYIENYPNSAFSMQAQMKILEIAYHHAVTSGSPEEIKKFIEIYPKTEYAIDAQKVMDSMTKDAQLISIDSRHTNSETKSGVYSIIKNIEDVKDIDVYSIYNLDVFKYFDLKKYSTDLQKEIFRKTEYYKDYLEKLKILRSNMLQTTYYYTVNKIFSNEIYDIKKRGFTLTMGNNLQRGSGPYDEFGAVPPKAVVLHDREFIVFKSLPSKQVENKYWTNVSNAARVTGGKVFEEKFFLQIDEMSGLEIEKNPEISIYFLFTINQKELFKYTFCNSWRWFNMQDNSLVANNVRIIIANSTSGKIYYDKTF